MWKFETPVPLVTATPSMVLVTGTRIINGVEFVVRLWQQGDQGVLEDDERVLEAIEKARTLIQESRSDQGRVPSMDLVS